MKESVRIAILTVSDTRTLETDTSGQYLAGAVAEAGHKVADRAIVPDDGDKIRAQVQAWVARDDVQVVITSGGTGFTGRDSTPDVIAPLFDKTMDGFSVVFHQISYTTVGLSTLQSRATAGLIDTTFVFVLPGSRGAAKDAWQGVISHQLDSEYKPCNLVDLMPRLDEGRE